MSGQCLRVTDGVLLTGSAIDAALYAVEVAQRARARNAPLPLPPSRALAALRAALSAAGQTDMAPDPVGQSGVMVDMTTEEAAGLLRCSARTVRRLALALGGRLVGGRWILDRQAVMEHIDGRNAS